MSDPIPYKQIDNVQTIISTLLENIFNDDAYQEYLKDLEESDTKASNKKVVNIKQTFSELKIFNTSMEPLFLANDIGIIIGASNVKAMIKNYTYTEKTIGYITDQKGRITKKTFLTRHGIYRIIFNNKTKLSEVFRGFIYKLLDHMVECEVETLKKVISEFTNENKELVMDSMQELDTNLQNYKMLYDNEKIHRIEIETAYSFSEMYIEQLKLDKMHFMEKIDGRTEDIQNDETVIALNMMKKKYFKEYTISIISPDMLESIIPKSDDSQISLESYKYNFDFNIKRLDLVKNVNIEEVFYINLTLPSKDERKKEDSSMIPVATDYIADRTAFGKLINILMGECIHYPIIKTKKNANNYIFRTTIEHINILSQNLILDLD